jgi:hypothetical protein
MPYKFFFRGISFNVKFSKMKNYFNTKFYKIRFSTNYKNIGFLYLIFRFCSVELNLSILLNSSILPVQIYKETKHRFIKIRKKTL